jgi:hypothetical protein
MYFCILSETKTLHIQYKKFWCMYKDILWYCIW